MVSNLSVGMSTTIDTVRTDEESEESGESTLPPAAWIAGTGDALDVSELPFDRVAAYARQTDGDVYLERKGGRTRLIAV